ncbi:MAG: DNA/RNA non-specific endonuclease [Bacillota bacterium]|nr:DNA/RNA non-specific endonuclease [Bacillota bacterium]
MKKIIIIPIIVLLAVVAFVWSGNGFGGDELTCKILGNGGTTEQAVDTDNGTNASADFEIPEYDGEASVTVNNNEPQFDDSLKTTDSFEEYGSLDKHGRCTDAIANLSVDTQPSASEDRGDISAVHPSGWKSDQGWERCHLIGWQLSGENDNPRNLVTGTHYMNVTGMLPYENEVAWYIEDTGHHVLYEVEPIFEGKNMVCAGVHMQAESIEDDEVSFNVFCFNVRPGYEINYKSGEVTVTDEELAAEQSFSRGYVLNTNSMKFHYPSCSSVAKMEDHNKEFVTTSREELIKKGYSPCGNCEP